MAKYILVDTANSIYRARHVVRGENSRERAGNAMQTLLFGIRKCWRDMGRGKLVFALEGDFRHNWRRAFYEPYKRNRDLRREAKTEQDYEDDKTFQEAFKDFLKLLDHTNAHVLRGSILEADDLIAGWVQSHPGDEHVIVSSDSDFRQLISENVSQFDPIACQRITLEGYFDEYNNRIKVKDRKTGEKTHKLLEDPEFLLFEKCIRGDSSDNIRPAAKGARKKGTRGKVGIIECFADRHNKGFDWNSFMRTRWTDENGQERNVVDDYERNRILIDLTAQPVPVRKEIDRVLAEAVQEKKHDIKARLWFLKFCGAWNLDRLKPGLDEFGAMLSS